MEWRGDWPNALLWIGSIQVLISCLGTFGILLRPGRIAWRRLLAASLFALLCALLAGAVARPIAEDFAAVLSIGFLLIAAVFPLSGIGVWLCGYRRANLPVRIASWLAVATLLVSCWATFVEPQRLTLEQHSLRVHILRSGNDPVRLGIMSDLHATGAGRHEHAAVDRLLAARPDLILIAGDIYQGQDSAWPQALPELRTLFRRLIAPGGAFLVSGSCDRSDRLAELVAGTPVRLLENEQVTIAVRDRQVDLFGVSTHSPDSRGLSAFVDSPGVQGHLRLILSHRPNLAALSPTGPPVDLVIAGQTHGGQIRWPWGSAIAGFSPIPNRIRGGGLHSLNHQTVYVSRGVGVERFWAPPLRLFCPPEVGLVVLE